MALETFTTTTLTRREAGFENNANVIDSTDIKPSVDSANAEIEACVSAKYNVPLSDNSNYSGSSAESFLVELATQLAASELIMQQFEGQGGDLLRMAQNKIDLVKEKLDKLKSGELVLIGSDGSELGMKESALSAVSGFPQNTDLEDPDEPTTVEPIVTMNEKF